MLINQRGISAQDMLVYIGRHGWGRPFDEIAFSDLALPDSGSTNQERSSFTDKGIDKALERRKS